MLADIAQGAAEREAKRAAEKAEAEGALPTLREIERLLMA